MAHPARRRRRPARLEPVHAVRRRLPALVRGCRRDLPGRRTARADARGVSGAEDARSGGGGLRGVQRRNRADPLAAVRSGPAARDPRQRARRAGRRAAARSRLRGCGRGSRRAAARSRARVGERLDRRLHRILRAPRFGDSGRAGARPRRRGALRPGHSSRPPMLGEDGGGAQTGLPDRGQRPAEGRPHGRTAARPFRRRRDRASRGCRHERRRRGCRLQRDGSLRRGHAPRRRRRCRGLEGAGRESGCRVSESTRARDDASTRRRRAEEGLAAREGRRGEGRAPPLGRRHEGGRALDRRPVQAAQDKGRAGGLPPARRARRETISTSSQARWTRSPPGRTGRR